MTMTMRWKWAVRSMALMVMLVMMLAWPLHVLAALGGDVASIENDRVHMKAALMRVSRTETYTIHEVRVPSGTMVREFVSPAGTVFAVAWQGPWQPDLRQLLGTFFEQYVQEAQSARVHPANRGPLLLEGPGLVVEESGRPRAFTGRAYLPQMMQGIDAASIR